MTTRLLGLLLVALWLADPVAATQDEPAEPIGEAEDAGVWVRIQALYEQAKAAGEEVPGNVYDWIKQDLANLGDWEYTLVTVGALQPTSLQKKMNELGNERWECFDVIFDGERYHLFFRRKTRSYLSSIPVADLLKLLPGAGAGDD